MMALMMTWFGDPSPGAPNFSLLSDSISNLLPCRNYINAHHHHSTPYTGSLTVSKAQTYDQATHTQSVLRVAFKIKKTSNMVIFGWFLSNIPQTDKNTFAAREARVVTNRVGFRIGCILHCQRDTSGSQFWLFSQHLLFVGQCRIEWNGQSILYDSKDNSTGRSHGTSAEVEH